MRTSRQPEEVAPYLSDESRMPGGQAEEVAWPETARDVCEALAAWHDRGTPVTVSGAGSGVVGGRVPLGGAVLATERLSRIEDLGATGEGPHRVRVQAGVPLVEIQRYAAERDLHYPPDATENGSFLGGNLATNASGARSFRFGATRRWVEAVRFALPDGSLLELRRGEVLEKGGRFEARLADGRPLVVPAPNWRLPQTTKHASGYYSAPGMDLIDLLIGSEGTLGVFVEAELSLATAPREMLAGIFFFDDELSAYEFVSAARGDRKRGEEGVQPWSLELFANSAIALLAERRVALPSGAHTAIFIEEGVSGEGARMGEDRLDAWIRLAQRYRASEDSWIASGAQDDRRFREFRHAIPLSINEKLASRGVGKVSTDTAVPEGKTPEMLAAYRALLDRDGLERAIFGHVGDDHVHVNIIPRDSSEEPRARELFWEMIRIAARMGGVVAAEHGLGKLKAGALEIQYGQEVLARMRAIREVFDPAGLLGRKTLDLEPSL